MRLCKRILCLSLALLLLVIFPLTSLAAPAVVPTVSEYIFDTLLSANGIDTSLSSVSSWLGQWSGYDDYVAQGKRGELGSFSQYLYNLSHSATDEAVRQKALENINTMTDWMSMDWSDVGGKEVSLGNGILNGWVDGAKGSAADLTASLQGYLKTFSSYGTEALEYFKNPVLTEYPVEWTKPDNFGTMIASYTEIDETYSSTLNRFTDIYLTSSFSSSPYVHKPYGFLVAYDVSRGKWSIGFSYVSASPGSFGKVLPLTLLAHTGTYLRTTGEIKSNGTVEIKGHSGTKLTPAVINQLPFPVFANEAAADAYAQSQILENVYNKISQGLPVAGVNMDAQTLELKVVPSVITLPQTGELAAELLDQLDEAMDRIDELEAALKNAGLAIGWQDVVLPTVKPTESETTGEGEETGKVTLADVIAKVEAVPAAISAFFEKKVEPDDLEVDAENMKLPVSLADKFPFCIPFDVAYLVKSMNASSQVPKFELPFKIHYQNINYEHTFVVDLSDWDTAVHILRTMLDLLFIAGLMSVTRDLIRG